MEVDTNNLNDSVGLRVNGLEIKRTWNVRKVPVFKVSTEGSAGKIRMYRLASLKVHESSD
jgi:hypothetical protein